MPLDGWEDSFLLFNRLHFFFLSFYIYILSPSLSDPISPRTCYLRLHMRWHETRSVHCVKQILLPRPHLASPNVDSSIIHSHDLQWMKGNINSSTKRRDGRGSSSSVPCIPFSI